MPRTKRTAKTINQDMPKQSVGDKFLQKQEIDNYMKEMVRKFEGIKNDLNMGCKSILSQVKVMNREARMLVSARIGNTTLGDLERVLAESTHFTVLDGTSNSNFINTTSAISTAKVRKNKRSLSLVDDEGYLTAENSGNSGRSRSSRSRARVTKTVRISRSLSKSKKTQLVTPLLNSYKTPINKKPPTEYGFVTPKVKPNTPQVILRRPKDGEMAISMQGSPLMVDTIISREPNVNIPLGDGRTISIQPQRGLRMSQLPDLDENIRRQIQVLRDNLSKVCALDK